MAFILDRILGWLDKDGQPISQNVTVSYRDLIRSAGFSRGVIRKAIDEAVAAGYISCIHEGKAAAVGQSSERASYTLRWHEGGEYQDTLEGFQDFHARNGHRTPIPNAFFRHVIPHEALTITKVVGAVIRHMVGYQNQFGGRRSQDPLSYRFIQQFANIPDLKSLRQAILSATASRYIVCVEEGHFHPHANKRKPAMYAIKWLENEEVGPGGPRNPAAEQSRKPSSLPVQNTQQHRSRNPSRSGSKNPAGEQFRIPSKEKTPQKDTSKQQRENAAVADSRSFQRLREAGFDQTTAKRLSAAATDEQIEQQIAWLPHQKLDQNQLGMLRKAIEENWSEPKRLIEPKVLNRERREKDRQRSLETEKEERKVLAEKSRRLERKVELRALWKGLSKKEPTRIEKAAFENQNSDALRRLFRGSETHRYRECLKQLDREISSNETLPLP